MSNLAWETLVLAAAFPAFLDLDDFGAMMMVVGVERGGFTVAGRGVVVRIRELAAGEQHGL